MKRELYTNQNISEHSFLITGGAGFIGSNLVKHLLEYGARKVRVLDDFSNGFESNISQFLKDPRFELIEGDIRDLDTCHKACDGIDFVSHQAALGSVPRSLKDPITSNSVNVSGQLNMLLATRDAGVKKLVYAASSSTYGDSKTLPKKEEFIGKPLSPYAVTKYTNELYAHVFALNYGMAIIGLRYFNVFGPNQDPNGAYAAVIPLFMKAAITNEAPTINGDGKQSRDFTFVANAIQANMRALYSNVNSGHEVVNVACGQRTDLNELWQFIKEVSHSKIDPVYGPNRKGDIKDSLADLRYASEIIGYKPTVQVKEGLEQTFQYFKAIFS